MKKLKLLSLTALLGFIPFNSALAQNGANDLKSTTNLKSSPEFINNQNRTYTACSYLQESNNFENGISSDNTSGQTMAEDFTIPAGDCWTINNAKVPYFSNSPTLVDSIDIRVHADAGGVPGAILESRMLKPNEWTTSVLGVNFGQNVNEFDMDISLPISLCGGAGGTIYWFSTLVYSTSGGQYYWEFATTSIYGLNATAASSSAGPWTSAPYDMVFELGIVGATTTDFQSACGSFTWIDGITYSANNNTATYNYVAGAANGCDSLVTLNLTISSIVDQGVTPSILTVCDSGNVSVSIGSSEVGINYYLRDDFDNSIIEGPIAGTGSGITFTSEMINTTKTYNVYAEKLDDFGVKFLNTSLKRLEVSNPYSAYSNELTVEAWINFDGSIGDTPWMGQSAPTDNMTTNVWLWHHAGGVTNDITFFVSDFGTWTAVQSTGLTGLTGWHHIATTADASGLNIYIDGVLDVNSPNGITTGIQNAAGTKLIFGGDPRFPGDAGRHGTYEISEVRVWNTSRTLAELQPAVNNCITGTEPGLVYYNKIDNNTGSSIATAIVGNNANLSASMNPAADWIAGPSLCQPLCTEEMSQLATVTVNLSTPATQVVQLCDVNSYTWPQTGITYTVSGMYNDTIATQAGCDSIITLNLTLTTLDLNVTVTDPSIMASQAGATYLWLDCDNAYAPVSGQTGQNFTATANGNYAVKVTMNGCSDTSACNAIATVGFEGLDEFNVSIYPNPTNGEVWINVSQLGQDTRVVVYSMDGKQILESSLQSQTELIDLTGFASGYYTIKVSNDSESFISKIRLF